MSELGGLVMGMWLNDCWSGWQKKRAAARFRRNHPDKPCFECPGCGYVGPFQDLYPATGLRIHAQCPACMALERHRLQLLVLRDILQRRNCLGTILLHFAPEPVLSEFFRRRVGTYHTADLSMDGVDHRVDLLNLPFADRSYDFVFASHVLEHIVDDRKAIEEIYRILRPGGVAVLPVPIVAVETIEYSQPKPEESDHVRAPGIDYFRRYEAVFQVVELYSSVDFADKYQPYVYEDRSTWPNARGAWPGNRHPDFVPVCHKLPEGATC